MILETLGRMRTKNAAPSSKLEGGSGANATDLGMESDYTHERTSHISTTTSSTTYPASSITSSPSPSSRSTKRYSNNLFASGRFREYSYLRSVSQRSGSSRGAASITPSDSDHSLREKPSSNYSESLRPATPEGSGPVSSVPSSPNDKTPLARSTSLISSVEDFPSQALADNKSSKHPSSNSSVSVQRVELALECVIRDFEEEAEDEILMPRTAHPAPRSSDVEQSSASSPASDSTSGASVGKLISSCITY
jgi:serine/arginine repetitive matrix protein 2